MIEIPEASGIDKRLRPRKSVLIVDDSPDMLMVGRLILEMEDYTVFTASSGKQALTVLNEIAEPGLILLDMCMDDMSGPEFLEILETTRPETFEHVPVVYLTASDQVPSGSHKGFLRKGIDNDKLVAMVHSFMDEESGRRG